MVDKLRIFDSNLKREKLINFDNVLARNSRKTEVHEIDLALRTSKEIVLEEHPIVDSETVVINGLVMTEGVDYDYTFTTNVLTFNNLVLPARGHVRIRYEYLTALT